MDMSKAALPAYVGHANMKDKLDPLFPLWQQHVLNCKKLMVNSSDFADWKYQYLAQRESEKATQLPEYKKFVTWMQATQAGARQCPAGYFPDNFYYWLEGGRW